MRILNQFSSQSRTSLFSNHESPPRDWHYSDYHDACDCFLQLLLAIASCNCCRNCGLQLAAIAACNCFLQLRQIDHGLYNLSCCDNCGICSLRQCSSLPYSILFSPVNHVLIWWCSPTRPIDDLMSKWFDICSLIKTPTFDNSINKLVLTNRSAVCFDCGLLQLRLAIEIAACDCDCFGLTNRSVFCSSGIGLLLWRVQNLRLYDPICLISSQNLI